MAMFMRHEIDNCTYHWAETGFHTVKNYTPVNTPRNKYVQVSER
jgi:hypothetical protein